jgi:DNA ligase-4
MMMFFFVIFLLNFRFPFKSKLQFKTFDNFVISATKAMNTDVKSTNRDGFQPCLHVFDILFLNDKVLTNLPLKERVKYLEKTFNTEKGRLIISEHKEAKTK